MATWPTTLPFPLKEGFTLSLGNNSLSRKTLSGKIHHVRYGSAAPDKCEGLTLRLFNNTPSGDQIAAFWSFYKSNLNMGSNWFSAGWISDILGYSDHKGKIMRYPEVRYISDVCCDISLSILIKKSSACPALDTTWPPSDE